MFQKIAIAIALACTSVVGCASVVNDTTHPLKVETKSENNTLITNAECKLTNDYGTVSVKSGETVQVRRSSKDLDIVCKRTDNPDATARAISRANGGMFGNIILGGGIGAIIDHNKGTAYTYPTWVQLVFGKSLVFDRSAEKEGQPTPPTELPVTAAEK
ncbi:hypothetical protein GCM10010975_33780 [Comamonas phosphati]|nr:hypothetical protein GCM10010975_33780 [Comamonas phosphati]